MSLIARLREGVAKAAETGEKATRMGQLKLHITGLECKLTERYAVLGTRCYELHAQGAVAPFADEKVQSLCQQIAGLQEEVRETKQEMERLREQGHASKNAENTASCESTSIPNSGS